MKLFPFSLSAEQKRQGLILFGLVVVYLLSRLLWLEDIPLYSDEAVHMAMAKLALAGDVMAGFSMSKWLTMQAYGLYFGFFPDTLFFARLLVVMIGLVDLLLIFLLARDMGEQPSFRRGICAATAYVASPFALFYDRLLMADQFQVFFLCCILLATLRIMRQSLGFVWLNSAALALPLLLAPLFKTNGIILAFSPVVLALFMNTPGRFRDRLARIVPAYFAASVVLVFALLFRGNAQNDTSSFLVSSGELILSLWETNIAELRPMLLGILSPLFCYLLLGGVLTVLTFSKDAALKRVVWICVGLSVAVVGPYMVAARDWSLRYLMPVLVPTCILAGVLMDRSILLLEKRRTWWSLNGAKRAVVLLFLGLPVLYSAMLIAVPMGYPCEADLCWFFVRHTSGPGVHEAARYLGLLAKESSADYIYVISCDIEDNMNEGLEVYQRELGDKVHRRILFNKEVATPLVRSLLQRGRPVYLARNEMKPGRVIMDALAKNFKMTRCWQSARPGGNPGYSIYRVENK